jgi:proliferating cell nuclear antigen
MFEIKIDDARYWKNCVESIQSLVDEGTFNITKEGISLKAMDPSGISMVSFFIPNKAFSKYEVDKPTTVGLNIDNLGKILASSRGGEQLVMKESGNKLSMEFIGQSSKRRFRLPIIDARKEAEKEPKIAFESNVEVKGESLKEILKDANLLSTYIGFKTEKESFTVVAKGDAGELEGEYGNNTEAIKKLSVTKPSSATFNLEYLERIIRGCPTDSSVSLSLKSEEPIRVDFKIGDATLAYYLAPYMET